MTKRRLICFLSALVMAVCCCVSASAVTYTTLRNGSRGDDVKTLQQALIDLGYLNDKADGIFGNKTENYYAILRCQNRFNNQFGELLMSLKFKKAFHLGIDYKAYPAFVDGSHDLIRLSNYDNAVVSFFEDENGVEYMCMVSMHRDRISSHKIFYDESKCKVHEMILNGKRVDYFPPTNPNELYGDFSFIPGQMRLFRIDRK